MSRQPRSFPIKIAYELDELLGFPHPRSFRTGPSYKAVKTIFKAIGAALRKGEDVKIDGFGIFRVHPRRRRGPCYPYPYLGAGQQWEYRDFGNRKIVKFFPSKILTRMLNEGVS
jgi:nucleoid DNA-binding protein